MRWSYGEGEEEGQDPLENFFNFTFDHEKGDGAFSANKIVIFG